MKNADDSHHIDFFGYLVHSLNSKLARPAGIEPTTTCLEGRCSIQLSYGRKPLEHYRHAARRARTLANGLNGLNWLKIVAACGNLSA